MIANLWDELYGRLTLVIVKYPETEPFIQSLRKHINCALKTPHLTNHGKLLKKTRLWLHEQSWKHPMFRDDFMAMVELIDKFEKGE